MFLRFYFNDASFFDTDFIIAGAKVTQCFYQDLKHADDYFQCSIPYDETLGDKIKADINRDVKAVVFQDATHPFFTGYLRKSATFRKTQKNQPLSIEVVSPDLLLNVDYKGNQVHFENKRITELILSLLSLTNFSGQITLSAIGNEALPIFFLNEGDNIKEVINELLFEFGYTYRFDANGNFYAVKMFEALPDTITQHFDGANCMNQIEQTVKEMTYKNITIKWFPVVEDSNVLIFEDTTGANSNTKANIKIAANSYYLNNEVNRLAYDSKYQEIKWIRTAQANITYDNNTGITQQFSNVGTEGELEIFNGSLQERTITQLEVKGSGCFVSATNLQNSPETTGNKKEISTKYIYTEAQADYLCKKIADYYKYANFMSYVQSHTAFDVGSFVDVSDEGIGTVKAKVIKRVYDFENDIFEYELESISQYDPIELTTRTQLKKSNSDGGNTVRSAVAELKTRVDEISVDTMNCGMSVTSVTLELDGNGNTLTAADISTTIFLRQSSMDVDFTIGTIALPAGWTYSIAGKTLTFHIGAGVPMRSGSLIIPVQYRAVVSDEIYEDEDGEVYEDESGNIYHEIIYSDSYTQFPLTFFYICNSTAHYLGTYSTIESISEQMNVGDYFVWAGDDTESDDVYDGEFKKARTYYFVGPGKAWKYEQDETHYDNAVVSDVLSIANADLMHNNSKVYEYLNHLTANSIFANLLTANQAFISTLATNQAFISILKATEGFFKDIHVTGNATFEGQLNSASGIVENLLITGNSEFHGDIDSGPLLLKDENPGGGTITINEGTSLSPSTALNGGIGTYNGYTFNRFLIMVTSQQVGSFTQYVAWGHYYLDSTNVYNEAGPTSLISSSVYYVPSHGNITYTYSATPGAKTFKLRDLPTSLPSSSGTVWKDSAGYLRIS